MFLLLRKSNLLLLGAVLLCAGVYAEYAREAESAPVVAAPAFGRRVVLDAGHGDFDGGASGASGVLEKDVNLSVVQKAGAFLEQGGIDVIYTRMGDAVLETEGKIRARKNADMRARAELINQSGADLFVSVHMNQFPQTQYRGPQVFYKANDENSKRLAKRTQTLLNEILKSPSKREIKPAGDGIYLLKTARVPAVLIECGFLSNREEEALLRDPAYLSQIAFSIFSAVNHYFNDDISG
jgi:N-acetylmuramoyl-L-alanine amidase